MTRSILKRDDQCSEATRYSETVENFLVELSWCANHFKWSVNRHGYIRGLHPEHYAPFCPIGAVWFTRYRKVIAPNDERLWDIADELKLDSAALHLSLAADSAQESPLRKKLLEAVGAL